MKDKVINVEGMNFILPQNTVELNEKNLVEFHEYFRVNFGRFLFNNSPSARDYFQRFIRFLFKNLFKYTFFLRSIVGYKNLKVEIPEGVKSIGKNAFKGCSSLTHITLPDSVESIGQSAFCGCSSLTHITLPDSVTSIGNSAFFGCSSLTTINIPSGVKNIPGWAFCGCSSLTTINIPNGVDSIGDGAFQYCSLLSEINIPKSVKSIGHQTFYSCKKLKTITLPSHLEFIGRWTFFNCSSLTKITLPNNLINIEERDFWCCTSLREINIPDSVTNIGRLAFEDCSSLTRINISDPNKNIFNGKTFLKYALTQNSSRSINTLLEHDNNALIQKSSLIINTLLQHGNNILVRSLPTDLQTSLFPDLSLNDNIDSKKMLKHLLSNCSFVSSLSFDDEILIDTLVWLCVDKDILRLLHTLIKNNKKAGNEERKDLSLLEQTIAQRTKSIFFGKKLGFSVEGKIQSFLNTKDLNSLLLTSQNNYNYNSKPFAIKSHVFTRPI